MNNLQIFRKQVAQHLNSPQITSIEQWQSMLNHLCDIKILSPKQIKILNQNVQKRQFPIKIKYFQQIIMREFGDEGTKNLMKDIDKIKKQIRETKGILAVWKQQGLSKSQIKQLQILFAKGNSKMKQICSILKQKKQLLQSINQPQIQLIKAMNQWQIVQNIKQVYQNYQIYQKINGKAIDNLYNSIRVREVHFKNKKSNSLADESIHSILGFNSKTDQQVEVTKIPKKISDFQKINTVLATYNAQRDLMLSPYFLRFLGFNTNLNPLCYYYFREHIETKNLQQLLKIPVQLQENLPIFKFWAGEIFRAFRDIYYQCSYEPILPIQLKHIEITEYGLRVIFKHVRFHKLRELNDQLEPELLENVGRLILQLLKTSQQQIESKIKSIQTRTLIYTLLKAKAGLKKYKQKIVPCYINFNNAQTHPLFQFIQDTQGMEIIDSYTNLFGNEQ